MNRLWKSIPPCMSDVIGFEAVMNQLNGLGVIDDPSHYKPVHQGGAARSGGGGRPGGRWGRDHRHGHGPGGGPGGSPMRVTHSNTRNEDIIYGTEPKVLRAAEEGIAQLSPDFVLLSHAPSSTMIGSDLETAAEKIAASASLPAAAVPVDGAKDYLYGVGAALEALGRLLIEPSKPVPGTLNILGCNAIDWTQEQYGSLVELLTQGGWTVCSCWGMKESTGNLRKAASAEVNLVVSEAGVRLADYMAAEFGTRCVFGAPFGKGNTLALLRSLKGDPAGPEPAPYEKAGVLVIGEQFTANALRTTLEGRGYRDIRVLSFYDMAPAFLRPGDRKLSGEDALAKEAAGAGLVIGDPDLRTAAASDAVWIPFPSPGSFSPVQLVKDFDKVGGKLDDWLDSVLPEQFEQGEGRQ